jgi:hypothetical protein
MALRLSLLFGTSLELWLNGQMAWDVWHTMRGEIFYSLAEALNDFGFWIADFGSYILDQFNIEFD